jgi:type II secretory pathway pseudopilin PulG
MRPRRLIASCPRPSALKRIAAAERGSFLIEAMVGAMILLVVGFGVLQVLDRSSALGGEQKRQAVAGNVAQSEQEQVRALSLAEQSNLRRSTPYTVGGITYTAASRADWVNDTTGDAGCTTSGSSADYLKLSTVVTWPKMGRRKAVTLESLITPGVRAFGAGQGSLAVQVTDRAGNGVSGLQLNLSGPATLSDATSASGCVLWGYLPAASGYMLGFSRPEYVTPDGSQVVSKPVAVVGDQTSNVALQYDRGGYLQTSFVTWRTADGALIPTNPQSAHVTNSSGTGAPISYGVTGSTATSPLLFPFSTAYTVQPDTCAASDVPAVPEPPVPDTPDLPPAVTAKVIPGTTTTTAARRLPSPNIRVTSVASGGKAFVGATVRVTTPCGTTYKRFATRSDGTLDDPGFPYTDLAICVSDGTRQVLTNRSNRNFNNSSNFTVNITASSPLGTCP